MTLTVTFLDSGREPKEAPNPKYPDGMDIDLTGGKHPCCETRLPYPAPRCGGMLIECDACGLTGIVTVAGRPDDPRHVKVPCKVTKQ